MLRMIAAASANGELPLGMASALLANYLCEDLLIESLHGRGINLRPSDDSMTLNHLDWPEIVGRWSQVANRRQAIESSLASGQRLCVKMPFLMDSLELLRSTIRECRIISCVRNGIDVVSSMLRKQWFNDEVLERELWPYAARIDQVNIPCSIPERYHARWPAMNAPTRACLMWSVHAELGLQQRGCSDVIELRYETLLEQPQVVMEQLAEQLGHQLTALTRRWIAAVRQPTSSHDPQRRAFEALVEPDVHALFATLNERWGYAETLSP